MITSQIDAMGPGRNVQCRFLENGALLSVARVMTDWRDGGPVLDAFLPVLRDAPAPAYFWETPPVTSGTLEQPFEMVLMESSALAGIVADPSAFAAPLEAARIAGGSTATFDNLGGDARLVVPAPGDASTDCAHLAAFSRTADLDLQRVFWAAVGEAAIARVSDVPLWVSTSGLGVFWLHVRLDTRPKYYTHAPYRSSP